MRRYVEAYCRSLVDDGLMCLCGILGAEIAYLPGPVAGEARRFFEQNVDWLARVIERMGDGGDARERAMATIATLEGAMILARSLGDRAAFDAATRTLTPR